MNAPINGDRLRLLGYGNSGLLVELDSLDEALLLCADLERNPPRGVIDLIPGARTVLISFDPAVTGQAALAADLSTRPVLAAGPASEKTTTPQDGASLELPIRYDGPDLAEVAALTGLSVAEVIERHAASSYLVAFTGFAPGFGYLSGGDPGLQVPRRDTPRTMVAAGAVGLAGEFTGIYPRNGPGGWQIIGHTAATMWDVDRAPAALLRPGVRVTFRPVAT
jgi:KipI family sensor histidine kinase inhibitor